VKRIFALSLICVLNSSVQFQTEIRPVFGVCVAYQSTGAMTTIVVYIDNGRTLTHKKMLSLKEFVGFASGAWPSIYNPNRIDYFELNKVPGSMLKDSISRQTTPYCSALDSLWKIRFKQYPFRGKNELGWSQDAHSPSLSQKKYLFDEYGVKQIDSNFFLDTSFWKILRDVENQEWIMNYKRIQ